MNGDVSMMFDGIEDPRTGNRMIYPLREVLLVALCAFLCGCRSCEDFAAFGEARIDFLRQYMPFENGIPSHDTFSRVFRLVFPAAFAALLTDLAGDVGTAVAIDGKALRGTAEPSADRRAAMSLCAYSTDTGLALGQVMVDEKSNEIPAVAELIRGLDLHGVTVTLDALHCQRATAALLAEAGARYILPLKQNQKTLHSDVRLFLDDPHTQTTVHLDVDGGHGRIETRIARVSTEIEWAAQTHKWPGLAAFGSIERVREAASGTHRETQLYLLGHAFTAADLAALTRGHWGIENRLHWVLDVSMGEDACRARRDHAPENLAALRRMALNAIRTAKTGKSVPQSMLAAMLNPAKLQKLVLASTNS